MSSKCWVRRWRAPPCARWGCCVVVWKMMDRCMCVFVDGWTRSGQWSWRVCWPVWYALVAGCRAVGLSGAFGRARRPSDWSLLPLATAGPRGCCGARSRSAHSVPHAALEGSRDPCVLFALRCARRGDAMRAPNTRHTRLFHPLIRRRRPTTTTTVTTTATIATAMTTATTKMLHVYGCMCMYCVATVRWGLMYKTDR